MGLTFDETLPSMLVRDFGGHPLLIRQMCSFLNHKVPFDRPTEVSTIVYDKEIVNFTSDEHGFPKYARLVLEVLEKWYADEFFMLNLLASDDVGNSRRGWRNSRTPWITLLSTGLSSRAEKNMDSKVVALKQYLAKKNKYKKPLNK